MIRIVIADDHHMVRAGIRVLLEKAGDIQTVGEACNGQEAVDITAELKPDVLVMDIMMPRMNGIQAAQKLGEPKSRTHILLLSMYGDAGFVQQALQSGVKGYVLKSSASDELLQAVRTVAGGKTFMSSPIAEMLEENGSLLQDSHSENVLFSRLSPREQEILQLIAEEYTTPQIAKLLFISEGTVEKHRGRIMEKLKARSVVGLVRLALKHHLVELN